MNRVRYPYVPQMVAQKRDIAVCANKIQLLSKRICYKVFCIKTSSGRVVATSFPYPMVHRSIAVDVPIYLKLAFKVTHHSENADFQSYRLRVLLVLALSGLVFHHTIPWPSIDIHRKFYGDPTRGTPPSGDLNAKGVGVVIYIAVSDIWNARTPKRSAR